MFKFSMGLYKDHAMKRVISKGSVVPVGSSLYIKIDFKGPSNLKMVVMDCIASPTEDPEEAITLWYLVKERSVVFWPF